jgi:flagellar hook-associated protein 2
MSTSGISVNSTAGAPITTSGLASGLDTSSIISALMAAERLPVTRLTDEQEKLQGQQQQLQSIQSALQQLALAASEFSSPSLFESSQAVTSSEPSRVSAATSTGAAIGGHEIEVTQLANAAQRTFSFTSPTSEQAVTIDGHAFTVTAGESAKELADAINSDSSATVYAAVLEGGATIVLSDRATGDTGTGTGGEFIQVSDPGGALSEQAGTAKEGKNAEYKIDGVAGSSSSNTVAGAIPGVTLTLQGLTTTGPVTIDVQPPGASVSAVEAQVQAFVKLYNSTVETIEKQLATTPVSKPQSAGEYATGSLFGDSELQGLLNEMRQAMYEPIAGLSAEMSSPADIGISTGAPTGGGASSQASLNGLLVLNPTKLSEAVKSNPAGVQQMLVKWSQSLQSTLTAVAEPGGTLEARINGDSSQVTELKTQISGMDEVLDQREKALQATYAELEGVISQNTAQASWLTAQENLLSSSTG